MTDMTTTTHVNADVTTDRGHTLAQYLICMQGIVWREALRFIHQRERFVSALVRPLVWLFIFAAGFRQVLGVSIIPPYETYVLYEVYIAPGLVAMIQLFNGMQSSLTMVYDRETGGMRTLLVSPFPRWWLLTSKLLAGTLVSILQVYAFLLIAWFWDIEAPPLGYLTLIPALLLCGFMLGALGMLISSLIKQLENFAGIMNFVIFPMFFASSALYPLWRVQESSPCSITSACAIPLPTRPNSFASPSTKRSPGYRCWSWPATPRCFWSEPSPPTIRRAAFWHDAKAPETENRRQAPGIRSMMAFDGICDRRHQRRGPHGGD